LLEGWIQDVLKAACRSENLIFGNATATSSSASGHSRHVDDNDGI
jgi:hypothetical protein